MAQEHIVIPFYIPTQPAVNACSHCYPTPCSLILAFYTYPCKRQHLAHEPCYESYVKSNVWKRGCEFCVKEFGISLNQRATQCPLAVTPCAFQMHTGLTPMEEELKIVKSWKKESKYIFCFLGVCFLLIFIIAGFSLRWW